ncbi:carboxypeptidase regulatory-like domain-containing protein [Fodinibius halophilus]|uniref:Carboxypeptidase regulatory-like domain-containing protein n=1 Tax=Fodinibius halophilus TaxID=1736908 RepID=A0A6M1TBZ6_9BACT|nr:carboxypeptidase regulatory-like domain-containing protein [Fodinibius halophilus]NGP89511.1 carboxypeptidase regulatory-like domain-containing protein [Fodinibius halophilus]
MKSLLNLSILLLFLSVGCSKSTDSTTKEILLSGQVLELNSDSSSDPIASANVTAGGETTTSSSDGDYLLYLEPGTYELKATKNGFEPYSKSITIPEDTDGHYRDIIMTRSEN